MIQEINLVVAQQFGLRCVVLRPHCYMLGKTRSWEPEDVPREDFNVLLKRPLVLITYFARSLG